ncbi:MAG TPA: LysR family transcriptional regulator [Usitatibacter sp.]|nr:LysR family transcriptional regulator [Usitatibacter sp.]
MDKLRALQYFVAAAREGTLSGAARRLDVSVPAVSKLITALEKALGATLFERTTQGLTLSADGARYLDTCQTLLEQLADADDAVSGAASRPRGTLVIGAPAFVLQNCLVEALPQFHSRYPEIQLDLRIVSRLSDPDADAADVLLLFGWHDVSDLVQRPIGQTRYHVLASPAYWASHGIPQRPSDLAQHNCLCFRNPEGTLLDLWAFHRGGDAESVTVSGWLASSDRDALALAALAGEGVVRFSALTAWQHVRSGRLVPVLRDWEQRDAPPVYALYRAAQRNTPKVRLFVDFATELFRRLSAEREGRALDVPRERPEWHGRRYGKASKLQKRR